MTTLRRGDNPAQAETFLAMRCATCDRRQSEPDAYPVRGARNYGGAREAAARLRLMLLGATKVAPC